MLSAIVFLADSDDVQRRFPELSSSRSRNRDSLGSRETNTAISFEGELMNMKAPPTFFYSFGAQSHRRSGTQNNLSASADPVSVAMTVENEDTRGVRHDRRQNVRRVDQR